jgi:hypothetical protein
MGFKLCHYWKNIQLILKVFGKSADENIWTQDDSLHARESEIATNKRGHKCEIRTSSLAKSRIGEKGK